MFTNVDFADEIKWISSDMYLRPAGGHRRRRMDRLRFLASRKARDEAAAMTRCGFIFEEVARIWLSQYLKVSYNRLLTFSREQMRAALEIDSACYDERTEPQILFEVGFSVTGAKAVRRKARQLRKAVGVARERWPGVRGCIVLVDAGTAPYSTEGALVEGLSLDTKAFREVLDRDPDGFAVLVLRLEEIWEFARDAGIPLDDGLRAQVREAAEQWRREFAS